jgi:hypothetical protein
MPPALHEQLSTWAKSEKNSLNGLVVSLLVRAAGERDGEKVRAAE